LIHDETEVNIAVEELTPSQIKENSAIHLQQLVGDAHSYTQKLPISLIKQQEKGVKVPMQNPSHKIASINNFHNYKKQVPQGHKKSKEKAVV